LWKKQYLDAKAHGLPVKLYHFMGRSDAHTQAAFFIDEIQKAVRDGTIKPGEAVGLCNDVEGVVLNDPNLGEQILGWGDQIGQQTGTPWFLYMAYSEILRLKMQGLGVPLWCAAYQYVGGWRDADPLVGEFMRQTAVGPLGAYTKNIDKNCLYDEDVWHALDWYPAGLAEAPSDIAGIEEPEEMPEPVYMEVYRCLYSTGAEYGLCVQQKLEFAGKTMWDTIHVNEGVFSRDELQWIKEASTNNSRLIVSYDAKHNNR
jgi:hypothetical protein